MSEQQVSKNEDYSDITKKLGRWWRVLDALYMKDDELDAKTLRKNTGISKPHLSTALSELEELKLISVRREKNPRGGQPIPFAKLTGYGTHILDAVFSTTEETATPVQSKPIKLDTVLLDICLDVVENREAVDEKTRVSYALRLSQLFTSSPLKALEHNRFKEWLEGAIKTASSSKEDEKIQETVRDMIRNNISQLATATDSSSSDSDDDQNQRQRRRDWVQGHIYLQCLNIIANEEDADHVRSWAGDMLVKIATAFKEDQEVASCIKAQLEHVLFSWNPSEDKTYLDHLASQLLSIACPDTESTRAYVKILMERMKKEAAEGETDTKMMRNGQADEKKKVDSSERARWLLNYIATQHLPALS